MKLKLSTNYVATELENNQLQTSLTIDSAASEEERELLEAVAREIQQDGSNVEIQIQFDLADAVNTEIEMHRLSEERNVILIPGSKKPLFDALREKMEKMIETLDHIEYQQD